jgi:hypothetical protein
MATPLEADFSALILLLKENCRIPTPLAISDEEAEAQLPNNLAESFSTPPGTHSGYDSGTTAPSRLDWYGFRSIKNKLSDQLTSHQIRTCSRPPAKNIAPPTAPGPSNNK